MIWLNCNLLASVRSMLHSDPQVRPRHADLHEVQGQKPRIQFKRCHSWQVRNCVNNSRSCHTTTTQRLPFLLPPLPFAAALLDVAPSSAAACCWGCGLGLVRAFLTSGASGAGQMGSGVRLTTLATVGRPAGRARSHQCPTLTTTPSCDKHLQNSCRCHCHTTHSGAGGCTPRARSGTTPAACGARGTTHAARPQPPACQRLCTPAHTHSTWHGLGMMLGHNSTAATASASSVGCQHALQDPGLTHQPSSFSALHGAPRMASLPCASWLQQQTCWRHHPHPRHHHLEREGAGG